jgi:hypothetical protein
VPAPLSPEDAALLHRLAARGVASPAQLSDVAAARAPGRTLAQELLARGLVSEAALRQVVETSPELAATVAPTRPELDPEPPPDGQAPTLDGTGARRPGSLPAGTLLEGEGGRWSLVREVARGGMGTVYEAREVASGARRAVKVIRSGRASSQQEARFRREAEVGARLVGHPGVVPVLGAGTAPTGELFCVMEFVDGVDLWERVHEGLPPEDGVRLVAEVARAVAFAHERGVIHRDLKPQNVLVTPEGQARLTDFGIAKALDEVHGLTATGQVMGTPRFMPPEQAEDSKRVDARTDVFGLGAILYSVLTRRAPIDLHGLTIREALRRVARCEIPAPRSVDPSIDPALDALIRRALARDPARRPQTAAAFAEELEGWLRGDRTVREPAPEPPPPRSTLPLWAIVVGVLVCLALGVGLGLLLLHR